MQRQPVIDMILVEGPLPTPRERQTSWLQFCFAMLADIPMENVSVVYADAEEAISVHLTCTCAERHLKTLTHWCTSEDEYYTFLSNDGMLVRMPLEPHAGEIL